MSAVLSWKVSPTRVNVQCRGISFILTCFHLLVFFGVETTKGSSFHVLAFLWDCTHDIKRGVSLRVETNYSGWGPSSFEMEAIASKCHLKLTEKWILVCEQEYKTESLVREYTIYNCINFVVNKVLSHWTHSFPKLLR